MFVRERDELIIVKDTDLNDEFVAAFENFHSNFPNVVCYVEDAAQRIMGIFSWREYKQASYLGYAEPNRSFIAVSNDDADYIVSFYEDHPGIMNIPVIKNGKVEKEYCFANNKWISENFEWQLIHDDVVSRVMKRYRDEVGNVLISNRNPMEKAGDSIGGTEKYAELVVMNMPEYYEYVRHSYYESVFKTNHVLSEYNLYVECLIVQMMDKFNENGISVRYFGSPSASRMSKLCQRDKELLMNPQSVQQFSDCGKMESLYADYPESLAFMKAKEYENIGFHFLNGHFAPMDYKSDTMNIVGGVRVTRDVPVNYKHSVYVYGICVARGAFCADGDTVESFLQKMVNGESGDWAVVNCGVAEGIVGAALNDLQYVLHSNYKPHDIVVLLSEYDNFTTDLLKKYGAKIYETSWLFEGDKEETRWFIDIMPHTTPRANKKIAGYIYDRIASDIKGTLSESVSTISVSFSPTEYIAPPDGILDYINDIKRQMLKESILSEDKLVGAIVMNCNPFTYGHQYLIEQARMRCDELLIFVVSEDRSMFAFEDRLKMVESAVSTIWGGGIHVFTSGRFMISQNTFPEYFYKEKIQSKEIDPSFDVGIFARYIAPELGIKIRFVGEEPDDTVTASYNRTMENILRQHHISFYEIPRIADGKGVISATRVRKCIKEHDMDGLKGLVPVGTLEIITKKYM